MLFSLSILLKRCNIAAMELSLTTHALDSWKEEKRSAYLYRQISMTESDASRKKLFMRLSEEAENQANLWMSVIEKSDSHIPYIYVPDSRTKFVAWLVRKLGPKRIRPVLAAIKIRGLSVYSSLYNTGHPAPQNSGEIEDRHRGASSGGGFRAAVFGVNDGLVSIACLVMGVAGAASTNTTILLTGVAGLLAGAFSMAAGEYISMRSQREMFEYQIGLERAELAQYPEEEAGELALIYMARGMTEDEAKPLAARIVANPKLALDTLAREELGLNPDELGSPWFAAISSFFAFLCGGLVPLLPYLFGNQQYMLQVSIALTAMALFLIGAILSLFTGRNAFKGGVRMLLIGTSAGLLTYGIGHFLGASLI
ncbi:VIT1/CCC1 transporter family protein [Methylovorus sp. MM2]|uniref:VIT1/CCC1 transporter family protein n=1 Tax=Methylovorus sp. MM2 TaxID=1848038 RepID=UPI0020B6BE34|nr:VIT1/CCC1 transporter family protein [Methylovorus sp. MM2]